MKWRRFAYPIYGNKLFNKILIYFLSLLLPIVIIGLIVYWNVDHLVKKDVTQKLSDNLSFSSRTVDVYLGMAQSTNNNLILSDTFQRFVQPYRLLSDDDKVNLPLVVRAIANNQNVLSSFVDQIFMYVDTDKVYTSQEVVDFNVFFDTFYIMSGYDKSFWKQKLQSGSFFELLPPSDVLSYNHVDPRQVIPSVTTQYVNGRLVTMVTGISASAITSTLKNNSIFSETSYFILDKNQRLVVSSDSLDPNAARQIADQFQGKEQHAYVKVDGEHALVVRIPSETYGLYYYSVTPIASFSNETSGILSLILWICLTLMIVGVVFSFIFSFSIYNPIKNIREILGESDKTQDTYGKSRSSDDWNTIGRRIDQLVKQHQDAALKINRYSSELLDQFFIYLLRGNPWKQQDTPNRVLDEIGFTADRYMCCCFMFQFKERYYHEIGERDRLLIQEKMKRVIGGIMLPYVNGYLLEYEPDFYVYMVSLKQSEDRSRFDQAIEKIKTTFEYDAIYCELTIGIGNIYDNMADIAKSYSEAITAMDRRKSGIVTTIADAAELTIEETYYYSFLDENKIVNGLKAGNLEGIKADVEALIELNRGRGVSYSYLGTLLVELWNTGIRYTAERQLRVDQFISESEYAVLSSKNTRPNELSDRLQKLFHFYERIIHETVFKNEPRSKTMISVISNYIDKNYHKDIYLESISGEIGLSAKYVSRIFKEGAGIGISEYISFVRMEKAKELLLTTDYKISHIADLVGISSRTTFLRVFKKHEGVSPMDYRNAHASSLQRRVDDM
ncbi:helix-turn-helix domain-containing protein [Paenibacillus cremeus]|uniref:AraC family transcriptional regulator n=1 Tax=Paenibacillus cremeus TaxID=2163881 RepID=A0A559KGD0_9BACL|nr:helix-turn-helix domain-containing protein [Paenibacillus cremeus]TVY11179.1 AraC family transcriptional regulator [Paenibacillus cremeus]